MHKLFLLSVPLIACSSAAMAADIAEPPVHDWSGIYAGINAGLTGSESKALSNNDAEFTGGALLGYSWQRDRLVLGVETDLNYLGLGNRTRDTESYLDFTDSTNLTIDSNWFGTVRGRIGVAADNLLFYGTGGLAYGHANVDWSSALSQDDEPLGSAHFSTDDVNWGWTAGAGVEYGIDKWSIGIEYLYVDLGDAKYDENPTLTIDDGSNLYTVEGHVEGSFDHNFSVVRATAKLWF